MSWFGGFFTGVSMSINAAFCLVIDRLANERDDLKKKLNEANKRNDGSQYRHGYRNGYNARQKESLRDVCDGIIERLHIEEGVEDTKKYMSTVINNMTKEQLEVVTLLVAQALEETPEHTPKNTITLDLNDTLSNGPAKFMSELEAISPDNNSLNVDVNVLVGGSKLMDIDATFKFSEDPETLSKFNNLLEDFFNSDLEEIMNRWTEGVSANESDISEAVNQQANDILVNESANKTDSDNNDHHLEMM